MTVTAKTFGFPKSVRILRRSDFRKVYDEGFRHGSPLFAAFCLKRPETAAAGPHAEFALPKIGFTVSRAMGKAVVRNRMKRRLREAVRLHMADLPPYWSIVFNGRKPLLDAEFPIIEREVQTLFRRCAKL